MYVKRILGRVSTEIIEEYKLQKHANKKIVIYDNDRRHCEKEHAHQFKDTKTFHYIMDKLEYIIENPDYVFFTKGYDERKNKKTGVIEKIERHTLEYYKTFEDDITVRVRVDDGNELKVKTVFPVNGKKIENKIKKDIYNKYIITEEEYRERSNI